ncbi:METK2 synthase, partial [Dicaeum eximium]|nr:METK2 synthase [Dicaeum eximium]
PLGRTEKARSGRGRGKYPPEPSAWSFPGSPGAAREAPTAPRGGEGAEAPLRNPRPGRERGTGKGGTQGRLTESGIVYSRDLDLKKPLYQRTAAYGHFGRDSFPWEVPKKLKY